MIVCDDLHDAIRRFSFEELVGSGLMRGVQDDGEGGHLALVNCPRCQSTLGAPIAPEEASLWSGR